MTRQRIALGALAAIVYVTAVVLANYLTTRYGFVSVGFGRLATAGTFAIGGALVVRDAAQDTLGRVGVLGLIAVAGLVSYLVADASIATASVCAFVLSELLDMSAYTPLRRRGRFGGSWWALAVVTGVIVGAIADTIVFLTIAFGWSSVGPALVGQLIGKGEVALALLLLGIGAGALLRQSVDARDR